jgi:predicted permease
MRWSYKFPLRLRSIFAKGKSDDELSSELEFHLQNQIEENIAQGMSPEESRYAALRELGGLEQIKEECRESRGVNWFEHALQDLRFAVRTWRRNPGFTLVLVMTLALGIGANAAIFSLVNGILIQPLPYPHSEQLVNAAYTGPVPEGAFVGFQQRVKNLEIAAYSMGSGFNLRSEGNTVRISGSQVSSNFFPLLGISPLMGRVIQPGDEVPGADRIAILNYGIWQARFGGDPHIVGRWITVDEIPRQVVGVMPADFTFPAPSIQLWIPAKVDAESMWADFSYWMIGRLKPGVDLERARAEFKSHAPQVVESFPWKMGNEYIPMFNIGDFQYDATGRVRPTLLLLMGTVALILFVACANVANLLLAKSAGRQREIAIRAALGANRRRIIGQLLTESAFLALAGAAAGVALGFGLLPLLKPIFPAYTPHLADVTIDRNVMAYSFLLSLVTGVLFGLAPAFQASKTDVDASLKNGAPASGMNRGARRLSSALVIAEVALAVVLVSGAGLLIKSLYVMTRSQIGIRSDHLLTAQITPASSFCRKSSGCAHFYEQLLQEVRALPGVKNVALSDGIPLYFVGRTVLAVEDRPEYSAQNPYPIWEFTVSPDYGETMDITLLHGRNFNAGDTLNSAKVVVIEKKLADFFWPGQDPVGKHIKPSWMKDWRTVVGVVNNVRAYNVLPDDYAARMQGAVYFPASQGIVESPDDMDLLVRTGGDPQELARELPEVVARINSTVAISKIRTMDEVIHLSTTEPRSTMWLFVGFASLALGLGLIGVYSVIAYGVAQRTREIGIRMALGAGRGDVSRMVLRQALYLTFAGLAGGLAGALALTRFMTSILHDVRPTDPGTMAAVILLVGVAGLAAALIPSRHATRVDPTIALKYE